MIEIYVGIDPGKTGAVSVIWGDGVVSFHDTPTTKRGSKREYNIGGMVDILLPLAGHHAQVGLEKIHAMPGQGVVSMFSMGEGYGIWKGILETLEMPYALVPPQTWKKRLMDGMPKEKGSSIVKCLELFPTEDVKEGLKLKKHHDRADALLIAEYIKRYG